MAVEANTSDPTFFSKPKSYSESESSLSRQN